jgi:hypothetical protein
MTNVPLTSGGVVGVSDLPGLQLGPLMPSAGRLFSAASEEGLTGADIISCPFRLLASLAARVPANDPAANARTIATKKLGLRCISVSFDQSGAGMMVADIVSKMNGLTQPLIARCAGSREEGTLIIKTTNKFAPDSTDEAVRLLLDSKAIVLPAGCGRLDISIEWQPHSPRSTAFGGSGRLQMRMGMSGSGSPPGGTSRGEAALAVASPDGYFKETPTIARKVWLAAFRSSAIPRSKGTWQSNPQREFQICGCLCVRSTS